MYLHYGTETKIRQAIGVFDYAIRALPDGTLITVGGQQYSSGPKNAAVTIFDAEGNKLKALPEMPYPAILPAIVLTPDGDLFVFGNGARRVSGHSSSSWRQCSILHMKTLQWELLPELPVKVFRPMAEIDVDKDILVIGHSTRRYYSGPPIYAKFCLNTKTWRVLPVRRSLCY